LLRPEVTYVNDQRRRSIIMPRNRNVKADQFLTRRGADWHSLGSRGTIGARRTPTAPLGPCYAMEAAMPISSTHGSTSDTASFAGLDALLPDLEALYKDIHAHPELSMHETRTAGIAAKHLRDAGYDVTTGVGKTGVVGLLHNGDGPVVMLRADMDALPVAEATGLPYASKVTATDDEGSTVPVMHACGHDMHTACLAGAAALLAQTRDAWRGSV